ncbi:MAG: hypothetical protein ACRDCE_14150 [Cetobacterium sp.]|uniref:hypothetical protein n=1 Tax=Cetobacterium sp. TaxID=2071632 RepID=UPI003EE54D29
MNDQLQQALLKIIDKTQAGVDASVEFLGKEIPDVVQQLLMYKTVEMSVSVFLAVAFIIAGVVVLRKTRTDFVNECSWVHDGTTYAPLTFGGICASVLGVCTLFISLLCLINTIYGLVKIVVAPKIWLIEYAASLAK